jgi:hypothetical protein
MEQPLRRPGHAPVGRIAQATPAVEIAPDFVDQSVVGIGLQLERWLSGRRLLPRSRDRHDQAGRPPAGPWRTFEWLAVVVERMMQFRRTVWRVQNRPIVKAAQTYVRPKIRRVSEIVAMQDATVEAVR